MTKNITNLREENAQKLGAVCLKYMAPNAEDDLLSNTIAKQKIVYSSFCLAFPLWPGIGFSRGSSVTSDPQLLSNTIPQRETVTSSYFLIISFSLTHEEDFN